MRTYFIIILSMIFCFSCKHNQPLEPTSVVTQGIHDYEYLKDQYFFLDTEFREQYKKFNEVGEHVPNQTRTVIEDSFELYIGLPGNDERFPYKAFQGIASLDGSLEYQTGITPVPGEIAEGIFVSVDKEQYSLNSSFGFVRLNQRLSYNAILATGYKTSDGKKYGTFSFTRDSTQWQVIPLKLLRDKSPFAVHKVSDLSWKHVYCWDDSTVETQQVETEFDIKVYLKEASGSLEPTDWNGDEWVTVFGLDMKDKKNRLKPDGKIDFDETVLKMDLKELHFRDLRPFAPEGYFIGDQLIKNLHQDLIAPEIYDEYDQSEIRRASNFYISFEHLYYY